MNVLQAQAYSIKNIMQMTAAYHAKNNGAKAIELRELFNYVDFAVAGAMDELRQELPAMIEKILNQNNIQIQVDKKSKEKVEEAINDIHKAIQGKHGK